MITESDVQQVRNDLVRSGVDYIPLQNELVDHVITDIEKIMSAGKSFAMAYDEVMTSLNYENIDFLQIQKDTKMLLDYRSRFQVLILAVLSTSLTGSGLKFFKVSGGSLIQLLSFLILSVLTFRFSLYFFRDKRNGRRRKIVAVLYATVGLFIPLTCIEFIFFSQFHHAAIMLNMIIYLLLGLSVLIFLKTYKELNIFGIEKETKKADLFLAYINIIMALSALFLNAGGFQMALHYLLYSIVGINAVSGLFLMVAYRFTNRLTGMLVVSVITLHIYYLVHMIHYQI